ncbi:Hypothetical Protein FCC1311_052062 [Hondaea fermentalgiana]|uniref:Uncharacterized protein n=1 Tax=Hondaea fermentalgiana TaxID=2315210 RepID=A0A2R5GEJ1_9STRA|nr:Hypothetical Protein FCC1311_052062 [Hondaea fermentalgiana]|eukprot:GBG28985.1 Hypothetical Protein FCC1311_052062 [Hondaea fermentalgiana]
MILEGIQNSMPFVGENPGGRDYIIFKDVDGTPKTATIGEQTVEVQNEGSADAPRYMARKFAFPEGDTLKVKVVFEDGSETEVDMDVQKVS